MEQSISNGLIHTMTTQGMFMMMQNKTNSNSDSFNNNMFTMMIITTVLASSVPMFINYVSTQLITFKQYFKDYFKHIVKYRENTITLSYRNILSKYGKETNNISEELLGILHYIKKYSNELPELYSLKQDDVGRRYDNNIDDYRYLPIYKIDQPNKVLICKKNKI